MAKTLNLKDPEVYRLAHRLAELTGQSMTRVVADSLQDKLNQIEPQSRARELVKEMETAARRVAALPVLDTRSDEEILGYDEHGLWK